MTLCNAPVPPNNVEVTKAFIDMCAALVDQSGKSGGTLRLERGLMPRELPESDYALMQMEQSFKIVQAYLWLARRFPSHCPDLELAEHTTLALQEMMEDGLNSMPGSKQRRSRENRRGSGERPKRRRRKQGEKSSGWKRGSSKRAPIRKAVVNAASKHGGEGGTLSRLFKKMMG